MSHQHWIITNRLVRKRRVDGRYVDRVDDSVREPLPTFRVAEFNPLPPQHGLSDQSLSDALERGVDFIKDADVVEYDDLSADIDPEKLQATRRLYLSLYKTMKDADSSKGDVLFFIHGFNYSWADALLHLQRLHDVYVVPRESPINQIVYFTWPSYGDKGHYLDDQEIAAPSGLLLGRLWGKTVRFYDSFFSCDESGCRPDYCNQKIHLAAHSMGNQVAEEFIRSINELGYLNLNLFGEALLLHADADWTALEAGRPMHRLPDYCDRIHIYNHHSDDALRVSEATKNSEKRLGRHGPRDLGDIPARTLVVDCSDSSGKLDHPGDPFYESARRIILGRRDSVSLRERLFDHWGYLNRPTQAADIMKVLAGMSSSEIGDTRSHKHGPLFTLE